MLSRTTHAGACARAVRNFCRGFIDDESGVTVIFMALMIGILVGMSAMSVDASRMYLERARLQAAADAAALAAVTGLPTTATADTAIRYAGLNMPTAAYGNVLATRDVTIGQWNDSTKKFSSGGDSTAVRVITRRSSANANALSLVFARIFGQSSANITATAVAVGGNSANGCVLSLNPTADKAIDVSGNGSLTNAGCGIYVNSNSPSALSCTGSCTINGATSVVGGVSGTNGLHGSPNVTGATAAADPYSSVPRTPPTGSCSGNHDGGISITAGPTGVAKVCSIDVKHGVLTIGAGIYYVENKFAVSNGSASIDATAGVTIVLDGNVQLQLSGGGTMSIIAPTSGPTAGIAFMTASSASTTTNQTLSGGSLLTITGVIYFPNQSLTVSGTGAISSITCTELVADKITLSGNANLQSECVSVGARSFGGSTKIKLVQ